MSEKQDPVIVDALFTCDKTARDSQKFGMGIATLADHYGTAGWLTVSGTCIDRVEKGKLYRILIQEVAQNGG